MDLAVVLRVVGRECRDFFDMLYRLRAGEAFVPVFALGYPNDQIVDIAHEYMRSERHFLERTDLALITLVTTATMSRSEMSRRSRIAKATFSAAVKDENRAPCWNCQ